MSGFAQGFANGFNLMEQHFARQDERDYRDRRAQIEDERYGEERDWRRERAGVEDARYGEERDWRRERAGVEDKRYAGEQQYRRSRDQVADERYGEEQRWRKERADVEDKRWGITNRRAEEQHLSALEKSDYELMQKQVNDLLGQLSAGATLDDQGAKLLQRARFPLSLLAGEEYQNAGQVFSEVMQGQRDYNDPQALAVMDKVLRDRILERSKGIAANGSRIRDIRLARLYPMDGGRMAFDLEVIPEQGAPYLAPLTEKGSADDKDFVRGVPVQDLMEVFGGVAQLTEYARANPQLATAVRDYMVKSGKVENPAGKMTQREEQQLEYLNKTIAQRTKELEDGIDNMSLSNKQQKALQREIATLREQATAILGMEAPKAGKRTPSEQHIADLKAGKIKPEKFAAAFGEEALRQYLPADAPAAGMPAPGPAPAAEKPPAAGMAKPQPATPEEPPKPGTFRGDVVEPIAQGVRNWRDSTDLAFLAGKVDAQLAANPSPELLRHHLEQNPALAKDARIQRLIDKLLPTAQVAQR